MFHAGTRRYLKTVRIYGGQSERSSCRLAVKTGAYLNEESEQRAALDDVVEGEEVEESRVPISELMILVLMMAFGIWCREWFIVDVVIERAAMMMRANLCVGCM